MGEFDGLAVGEELDVNLSGADKGVAATDEGEHAAVGGEDRIDSGVGEESELLPLF